MNTQQKAVDVLAIMTYAVDTFKRLNREAASVEDHVLDIEDAENALAAVAELIAADHEHDAADAEIRRAIGSHGLYSEEHMDAARCAIPVRRRRAAALARVGGAG